MNFLKILNQSVTGGGQDGSTTSSSSYADGRFGGSNDMTSSNSSSSSRTRSTKRVYTASETTTMKEIQFLLTKMETLTLPEDRRQTMEAVTQLVRDNPELVSWSK